MVSQLLEIIKTAFENLPGSKTQDKNSHTTKQTQKQPKKPTSTQKPSDSQAIRPGRFVNQVKQGETRSLVHCKFVKGWVRNTIATASRWPSMAPYRGASWRATSVSQHLGLLFVLQPSLHGAPQRLPSCLPSPWMLQSRMPRAPKPYVHP